MLICTSTYWVCKILAKSMWFKSYEHFYQLTTTGSTDAQQSLVHQKSCNACQWLAENVDMYIICMQNLIKIYQNVTGVMSIFTSWSHSDYSAHLRGKMTVCLLCFSRFVERCDNLGLLPSPFIVGACRACTQKVCLRGFRLEAHGYTKQRTAVKWVCKLQSRNTLRKHAHVIIYCNISWL